MPTSPIPNASWDGIIKQAAKDAGTTTEKARSVMQVITASIKAEMLKNKDFPISNFGTFSVKNRPARNGRNPRTKKPIRWKSIRILRFSLTTRLKSRVKQQGFAP